MFTKRICNKILTNLNGDRYISIMQLDYDDLDCITTTVDKICSIIKIVNPVLECSNKVRCDYIKYVDMEGNLSSMYGDENYITISNKHVTEKRKLLRRINVDDIRILYSDEVKENEDDIKEMLRFQLDIPYKLEPTQL